MQFLSFENYFDLNQRVMEIENALETKGLLKRNKMGEKLNKKRKYSKEEVQIMMQHDNGI